MWNLSSGKVISLDATPRDVWDKESPDPPEGNDDWFATKMGDIIGRTEELWYVVCKSMVVITYMPLNEGKLTLVFNSKCNYYLLRL